MDPSESPATPACPEPLPATTASAPPILTEPETDDSNETDGNDSDTSSLESEESEHDMSSYE